MVVDDKQHPSGVRYVDPFRDAGALTPIGPEERRILRTVNQKIAARPSLRAIVDYLFDSTQAPHPLRPHRSRLRGREGRARHELLQPRLLRRSADRSRTTPKRCAAARSRGSCRAASRASSTTSRRYLEQHPRSRSTQAAGQGGRALQSHLPAQRGGPHRRLHLPQLARGRHLPHPAHRAADGHHRAPQPGRREGLAHRAARGGQPRLRRRCWRS